jgi:hypothetical protein
MIIVIMVWRFYKLPMEKYRESKTVAGKTVSIDVCLNKGAGTRKVSLILDDAWQHMRSADGGVAVINVDAAVRIIRKHGYRHFLIDAAGNMYASGLNCSRKPWTIAIKNPEDMNKIFDVIELSDVSVTTLGPHQIPGQKVMSVTVIAKTAQDSRALASSLSILEPKKGVALIDSLGEGLAGLMIGKDPAGRLNAVKSANYKNFQIRKHSR